MSGYLRAAFSTVLAAVILGWGTGVTVAAAPTVTLEDKQDKQDKIDPQAAEFFEKKVRPLLFDNCFGCHGDKRANGSLRLDSLAAMLKGSSAGPVLVPGDPDKSKLISAIQYIDATKMPPSGKLSNEAIANITRWVKMGAPWPGSKPSTGKTPGDFEITPEQQQFWSFKPVHLPAAPKVKSKWWVQSPVDAFILAKLEAKGLKPSPPSDRRTLLRRATYDLTGLPPTQAEVDVFINDKAPGGFARVVDRLLASPAYGERWGRHWLDVARYADTKGYAFTEDPVYHNAYTYRDYVIRAFNEDLPYGEFLMEQLAADKMPQGDDKRKLAALGFLNVGRRFLNDPVLINDDRIDSTCRGMLALTVGCARCHNHKFDPISAKDYYALYGVFASAVESNPPPAISPKTISEPYEQQNAKIRAQEAETNDLIRAQMTILRDTAQKTPDEVPQSVKTILQSIRIENLPDANQLKTLSPKFAAAAQDSIKRLQASVADLRAHMPPTPEFAMASQDTPHPFDSYVFLRGNPGNRGENVPRRFLQILSPASGPTPYEDGGRLRLAQDIANKTNPLTARVYVNRVWMYHFGAAIVRTPSDFGFRGEPPTNPELLDWLAATFMQDDWSIKKLHRKIMLSSAYQQSSEETSASFTADPENRLVHKQNRQRLDFEGLRDALLAISGKLDSKVGGPAVELTTAPFTGRRTVYGFIDRQNLQGLFRTFDFASPDTSSAQRFSTTVPQQSLYMMNSPFVVEQARALAHRPEVLTAPDDAARIQALYHIVYQRPAAVDEVNFGIKFLAGVGQFRSVDTAAAPAVRTASNSGHESDTVRSANALTPLEEYVQTLLLTNEFLFVD